jgi:hypothetical protein
VTCGLPTIEDWALIRKQIQEVMLLLEVFARTRAKDRLIKSKEQKSPIPSRRNW